MVQLFESAASAGADLLANESVQNVRLLSGPAPTVSLEPLAYDCRLMNIALAKGRSEARQLRDWLVESDAALDPQAFVLRPDVVLRLSQQIVAEKTAYRRTRRAVLAALDELRRAHQTGAVKIPAREVRWLDTLQRQADSLPESETGLIQEMLATIEPGVFLPDEYGVQVGE